MGSLNGTFVNDERITEAILPPGDLLRLGTVTFRAAYDPPMGEPPEAGAAQRETAQPEIGLAADDEPLDVQEVEEVGEVEDFGDFEIVELDDGDRPTEVPDV